MSDTIAVNWDNKEDMYCVNGIYYHVSDKTPTFEELVGGMKLVLNDGYDDFIVELSSADFFELDNGVINCGSIIIVPSDGMEAMGELFEKKGIYVVRIETDETFVVSFTINGYNGFETTEVKTIDPKYLPEDYLKQLIAEVTGTTS